MAADPPSDHTGAIVVSTVVVTLGAVAAAVLVARSKRVRRAASRARTTIETEAAYWRERKGAKKALRARIDAEVAAHEENLAAARKRLRASAEAGEPSRAAKRRAERARKAGSADRRREELLAELAELDKR